MTTKRSTRLKRAPVSERAAHEAFPELAAAIEIYLEAVGWRAVLVSAPRVQQQFNARKYNYEFVVQFTGGKVQAK